MARISEKREAIRLRRQGRTYSEIRKEINVAKSTLSDWLKKIPLDGNQILHIKDIRKRAREKFIITMQAKREARINRYYIDQKKNLLPFSNRELFLAGLFLYWGQGNKSSRNLISINNTDPSVVKFALKWIVKSLKFPKEKIRVQIHLYKDMNIEKELSFWSKTLTLKPDQFCKPYIKKSSRIDIDQKGFGHGTCGVYVCNTIMKENILMAIKVISDNL